MGPAGLPARRVKGEWEAGGARGVLGRRSPGPALTGTRDAAAWLDLVHVHYWLSGHVGAVAKERWGVPFVQSMHTLGKVKNAALARGDMREPDIRLRGESDVVASADRLVANTDEEARQLARLYGAEPARIWTVNPGVDLSTFRPGPASAARRRLGLPEDGLVIVFAGRIQPLKAPDVVLHAAADLIRG